MLKSGVIFSPINIILVHEKLNDLSPRREQKRKSGSSLLTVTVKFLLKISVKKLLKGSKEGQKSQNPIEIDWPFNVYLHFNGRNSDSNTIVVLCRSICDFTINFNYTHLIGSTLIKMIRWSLRWFCYIWSFAFVRVSTFQKNYRGLCTRRR